MQTEVKTSVLVGHALNFLTAQCQGVEIKWSNDEQAFIFHDREEDGERHYSPCTDWAQGGPIIDMLKPAMIQYDEGVVAIRHKSDGPYHFGPTLLIAAMRCFITSRLGDTVLLPSAYWNKPESSYSNLIMAKKPNRSLIS